MRVTTTNAGPQHNATNGITMHKFIRICPLYYPLTYRPTYSALPQHTCAFPRPQHTPSHFPYNTNKLKGRCMATRAVYLLTCIPIIYHSRFKQIGSTIAEVTINKPPNHIVHETQHCNFLSTFQPKRAMTGATWLTFSPREGKVCPAEFRTRCLRLRTLSPRSFETQALAPGLGGLLLGGGT